MKQKIAIVAGGFSSEHDVSLRSAKGIYDALDKELFDATVIELPKEHNKALLAAKLHDLQHYDYCYITIHGTPGENGLLQGYLQILGIPFNCCSVLPAALTFNKYACNHYLSAFGINIARSILLRADEPQPAPEEIAQQLGLPCFIKSNVGGSSFGCTKVKTLEDIQPAIDKAFAEGDEVICEQLMVGTEVTNGCYATREGLVALPVTEVVTANEFFDYNAKYNGEVQEITPARIPDDMRDRIQALTKKIYRILGAAGIIRIDYILENNEIRLLEVNTTPGMTPTSFIPQQIQAAGLNLTEVLTKLIQTAK